MASGDIHQSQRLLRVPRAARSHPHLRRRIASKPDQSNAIVAGRRNGFSVECYDSSGIGAAQDSSALCCVRPASDERRIRDSYAGWLWE